MSAHLALDFANTAEWHAGPEPQEQLTSYRRAATWAREHGILSDDQAARLIAQAEASPELEEQALRRIIQVREAIYHLFSAVAHHRAPADADLRLLEGEARKAAAHLALAMTGGGDQRDEAEDASPSPPHVTCGGSPSEAPQQPGPARSADLPAFEWRWLGVEDELTGFLWPIAWAATEMLTSGRLTQLRECAGDPCGWLFLDLSKNASRRWCDMADCGNRAKARRYRERQKQAAAAPPDMTALTGEAGPT